MKTTEQTRAETIIAMQEQIDKLKAELAELQWIPVRPVRPVSMPKNKKKVFVLLSGKNNKGKDVRSVTVAFYIAPETVLAEDWLDDECPESFYSSEYDKDKDCYWTPSGFYEYQIEADRSYYISDTITHWMPIIIPKEGE